MNYLNQSTNQNDGLAGRCQGLFPPHLLSQGKVPWGRGCHWFPPWNATLLIHMADSPSGQDKTNPVFLLATRAGTMVARDILRWSRQEKLSFWPDMKTFIDQAYSVKMAWYRPHSFLRFYWPRQRKKELVANIQPCWPNTLGQWCI